MPPNNSNSHSRFRWVDFIRALAAFFVVLAHVRYSGGGSPWVWTTYYALTRVAVPLFFMASGYLLLSKNEPILDFFRKRALKVFLPFLIWSVIYLIWKQEAFGQPLLTILKSYFVKILRGPRENHLWFFYELFGLYLFTPILRVYVERASTKDLYYFCGIWFLLVPLANLIREFTPLKLGFSYQFLGGYIGYFIFGYLAGRAEFSRRQKIGASAVFIAGLLATISGMRLSQIFELKTQYFEDYMSVNVALMSAALLIVLTRIKVPDPYYRLVSPLSGASFGIYLAHVIVMTEIFSMPLFSGLTTTGSSIYMVPILGVLGFLFSFALVSLLQKVPILKFCVP